MSRNPVEKKAIPADSLDLLEFAKVAEKLAGFTASVPGRAMAQALLPHTDPVESATALTEAAEALLVVACLGRIPIGDIDDILPMINALHAEGAVLSADSLAKVRAAAESAVACRNVMKDGNQWPWLQTRATQLVPLPHLIDAIRKSIGPRGEIMDSASATLYELRCEVHSLRLRIKRQLESLLADVRYAGVFQERLITDRNDRYVLPVRADHAGRLRGFVHDISASGQTLFVEPAATLDANNRLQTLLREVQREEERILRDLTSMVRDSRAELAGNQHILAVLDLRMAIANFSRELDATIPTLSAEPELELFAARHPLLVLQPGVNVVPIDLRLGRNDQTLVISGPNTGGKTAALKTAGLMVLMARAGLPLPCAPGSRLYPFTPVLADIGDDQSLERHQSTFSGHLGRLRDIMSAASEQTLVLLDELGTGTDPGEGGALALAILDQLRQSGARTIITTHLHLIKGYAHLEEEVKNAAVEFDTETLQPSFHLNYGIPGASHAFTIARRLGLPDKVLARAASYLGHGERAGLAVLERLQTLRAALDEELSAVGDLRRKAEHEQTRQQRLREDLEVRQREILEEVRQSGNKLLAEAEDRLRSLFREARVESGSIPVREQARLTGNLRSLRRKLPQPAMTPPGVLPGVVQPNELLYVVALGLDAKLVASDGLTAVLELGGKRLRQPLTALRQYQPPRFVQATLKKPKIRDNVSRRAFQPRLVVVGKRVEETLELVAAFLDEAMLYGAVHLEIIHGAGEGVLRKAIREFLAGRREVAGFGPAEIAEGGDNLTVVELR